VRAAAGQAFYNISPFVLRDLTSRGSEQKLRADFEVYLEGFSETGCRCWLCCAPWPSTCCAGCSDGRPHRAACRGVSATGFRSPSVGAQAAAALSGWCAGL
jgi:hypothetical protein